MLGFACACPRIRQFVIARSSPLLSEPHLWSVCLSPFLFTLAFCFCQRLFFRIVLLGHKSLDLHDSKHSEQDISLSLSTEYIAFD